MTKTREYDGLPFFIKTGKTVSENDRSKVRDAIARRIKNASIWADRTRKGRQIIKAMKCDQNGAVQNINMIYAYNGYQKFLTQSLLSLKDVFRVSTNDYKVDVERPKTILKSYLDALQYDNSLIANDAILYGCASVLSDVDLTERDIKIRLNRVMSDSLFYDYEQPGVCLFNIRLTPEMAFKLDFLDEQDRMRLYNRAISSAESVVYIRVFVGELVVNNEVDNFLAIIYNREVLYAERDRVFTNVRSVSIYDSNSDFSPIYTVLKASEISQDNYRMVWDYNKELANPIRTGPFDIDAERWEIAKNITRYYKVPNIGSEMKTLLPGEIDVNGLVTIQNNIQQLAQQAAGLNDYTLGVDTGSVRTYGEAMMLADSASGIMNILANKLKQKLILPILDDILEVLKIYTKNTSDIFNESLYIDTDIIKDQQESNTLVSLINMPMFGGVIQGLDSMQALLLMRWILEKLHISGTSSIFDTLINNSVQGNNKGDINGRSI